MDRRQLTSSDRGRLVRRIRGGRVELGVLKDWNIAYLYVEFTWSRYAVAVSDYNVDFVDFNEDPFRISPWSTDEFARERYESMFRRFKRLAR